MKIRVLEGEDAINQALMGAMEATVKAFIVQGLISREQGEKFFDEHICMAVAKDGPFVSWFKRVFGADHKGDRIVVARIGGSGDV